MSPGSSAKPLELLFVFLLGAAVAWSLLAGRSSSRGVTHKRKAHDPTCRQEDEEDDVQEVKSGFLAYLPSPVGPLLPLRHGVSATPLEEPQGLGKETMGPLLESLEQHVKAPRQSTSGPLTLGVAGGSGSGKTTFARALYEALGEEHVTYITHDSYYKDLSHLPFDERKKSNFDHPNALDTALLVEHLRALKRGHTVEVPEYDFVTHNRLKRTCKAEPRPVILLEGILIFADRSLVQELAIKVFVDTESDLRLIRRIHRDVKERGRSLESIVDQYVKTVRPMHLEFVEPSKREADVIIPLGMNQVALDMFLSRLQAEVGEHLGHLGSSTSPDKDSQSPKRKAYIALGKQGSLSLGNNMGPARIRGESEAKNANLSHLKVFGSK